MADLKKTTAADYKCEPTKYGELTFEQGCFGARWPAYNSPLAKAGVTPGSPNSLKPDAYFLITWFGKAHYVSPVLYKRDADIYNMLHWKEGLYLFDEIHSLEAIYREWSDPSGFMDQMVASSIYTTREATDWVKSWFKEVKRAPKPDIKEFGKLSDRALKVLEIVAKNDLKLDVTVKNGLELAAIRNDLKRLNKAIELFRNNALETAETMTQGLETVESASFSILNVVPTITMMDPLREAAYKISVLLVRTAARGTGGALAYGTKEAFLNEAFGVLKREVPNLIVDLLMSTFNKLAKAMGMSTATKEAMAIVIQQVLEFTVWFVKTVIENKGKSITRDQWEQQAVERFASIVGIGIMKIFPVKLADGNTKVAIKATAEAVAKTLVSSAYSVYKQCDEKDRDVTEAIMSELPTFIMRVAEAAVVGFAQRKASQGAEYLQQNRIIDQTDFGEAASLGRTTVSEIWNNKMSRSAMMEVRAGRTRAIGFTKFEYNLNQWSKTNLEYETASGVRRYADECQMYCFYHAPNKSRLNHTESAAAKGAKWGKPGTLQTKSADGPDLSPDKAGLVVKPGNGPPATHKDVAKANKIYAKYLDEMVENGMMVRPDGVVFHPDQLETWGKIKTTDAAACKETADTLNKLQREGVFDLSPDADAPQKAKLDKAVADGKVTRQQVDDAKKLLDSAKIGFYSDLDPIDFVDANNGKSVHFGQKAKKGETFSDESIDIGAENRRLINEYVSKDLKGKNIDDDPRENSSPGAPKREEHPESEIQHGASMQMYGRGVAAKDQAVKIKDGAFAVGPLGEIVFFKNKIPPEQLAKMTPDEAENAIHEDIMKQWDDFVKGKVGDENFKDQARRVDEITKTQKKLQTRVRKVKQTPPEITNEQLEDTSRMLNGIEVLDEPGLGPEVPELGVLNSLKVRGLSFDTHKILGAAVPEKRLPAGYKPKSVYDVRLAMSKHGTYVGVSEDESQIVIAVRHYQDPIANALYALAKTREAIGLTFTHHNNHEVKFFYEIYTAYRPVTTSYIRDRIGGPKTGLPGTFADMASSAPTFAKPDKKRVLAFSVKGVTEAYTPEIKNLGGKFVGLWLHEVLEDVKTHKLSDRPVKISNENVSVFTSPIEDDTHVLDKYQEEKKDKKAAIAAAKEKAKEKAAAGVGAGASGGGGGGNSAW